MQEPTEPPQNTPERKRRKPEGEAREAVIPVRMTPAERDELAAIAEERNTSLSGLLRALALSRPLPRAKPPKLDADAYLELSRIGNNLNQIARQLNAAHLVPPYEDMAAQVKDLRAWLQKVHAGIIQ